MADYRSKYTGEEIETILDNSASLSINDNESTPEYELDTIEYKGKIYKVTKVGANKTGVVNEILSSITIDGTKYSLPTKSTSYIRITNAIPVTRTVEVKYSTIDSSNNTISVSSNNSITLTDATVITFKNAQGYTTRIYGSFIISIGDSFSIYNSNTEGLYYGGNEYINLIPLSDVTIRFY